MFPDFETWKLNRLHHQTASVATIAGVSLSERESAGTRRVDFLPGATQQEIDDAHAIADGHDTLEVVVNGAVITSPGLPSFNYAIFSSNHELLSSGAAPDGSLNLLADPESYIVEISSGDATGYAEVIIS